jgi:predicted AAA+ superfamily ATPase
MIARHLEVGIRRSLVEFPAVLVIGARQVGKSTLVRSIAESVSAGYRTLDDRIILDAASHDPQGFVDAMPTPAVIDEVQRAPDLLLAIKRAIDRNRRPGQFLLTGSANPLTMHRVADRLSGRIAVHELLPFCLSERFGCARPETLDIVFQCASAAAFVDALPGRADGRDRRAEIQEQILSGGFPTPALMESAAARTRWFDAYRQTYLERDLRDLAIVANLPEFTRLLTALAQRTGQLINFSEVSRDLGVPLTTLRRYVGLLETTFQVFFVHPYHADVGKRLVKRPKLYAIDTGLACHLSLADTWETLEKRLRVGALVETWAASEVRKLISFGDSRTNLWFWNAHGGHGVDLVLERGEQLIGLEIKWASRLTASDFAGLRAFLDDLPDRVLWCAVLYPGPEIIAIDERIAAIPLGAFFDAQSS